LRVIVSDNVLPLHSLINELHDSSVAGNAMTPTPTAIGLWICERVVIEQGTRNPSVIAAFDGLGVEQFPARPLPFSVFSTLTDAVGRGTISLRVCSLQSGDLIYRNDRRFTSTGRLTAVNIHFRVETIIFPVQGCSRVLRGQPARRRRSGRQTAIEGLRPWRVSHAVQSTDAIP
jgi:hypothetical protein